MTGDGIWAVRLSLLDGGDIVDGDFVIDVFNVGCPKRQIPVTPNIEAL
jgi:hypothetical protein